MESKIHKTNKPAIWNLKKLRVSIPINEEQAKLVKKTNGKVLWNLSVWEAEDD